MNARDVQAAYERGVRAMHKPRGDQGLVHVSDLKACAIATRARLLSKPMLAPSVQTLATWALGHAGEAFMADALATELQPDGWQVERDVLLWAQTDGESIWSGRVARRHYPRVLATEAGMALDRHATVFGHADILATKGDDRIVLEAKTEKRKAAAEASWFYRIQAGAYGLMAGGAGKGTTAVGVIDRRDGEYAFFDVDAGAMADEIARLMQRTLALFHADPAPETDPPAPWLCSYCDYGDCSRNANPERLALQEVV